MSAMQHTLLARILKKFARVIIWKYRPGVVGITGSVGKTSTKRAVAAVLSSERDVRFAKGNLNNELGLPIAILGDWRDGDLELVSHTTPAHTNRARKFFFWTKVLASGVWQSLFGRASAYPEILILEYGADRPGDIKRLLSIVRPNISIVTAVGDIPVHVEFYANQEEVLREKAKLVEYLPAASFAVLNYDDEDVRSLGGRTRARVVTYGFEGGADVRVSQFENRVEDKRPAGISFKLEYGGSVVPMRLDGVVGKTHACAAAAAAAVGLIFGMNLATIAEALKRYMPAEGRMEILPGVKASYLLNDAYNASPLSMRAALETLGDIPASRKVAILGDMLEIGKYTMEAHERIGRTVASVADALVTIGPRAKFIAEGAHDAGMPTRAIVSYDTVDDAEGMLAGIIKKGDLVLIKGSHGVRLEETVRELKSF